MHVFLAFKRWLLESQNYSHNLDKLDILACGWSVIIYQNAALYPISGTNILAAWHRLSIAR